MISNNIRQHPKRWLIYGSLLGVLIMVYLLSHIVATYHCVKSLKAGHKTQLNNQQYRRLLIQIHILNLLKGTINRPKDQSFLSLLRAHLQQSDSTDYQIQQLDSHTALIKLSGKRHFNIDWLPHLLKQYPKLWIKQFVSQNHQLRIVLGESHEPD